MENLTKQRTLELHKKKWTWIAEETEKQKRVVRSGEYFKAMGITEVPHIYSYCCEYSKSRSTIGRKLCQYCPVHWDKMMPITTNCPCMQSYYGQWAKSHKWREAAELARKIAELGEK